MSDNEISDAEITEIKQEQHEAMLKVGYYSERVEHDNGDIVYEIHGPHDTFIVFQGFNAKNQCAVMLAALSQQPECQAEPPSTLHKPDCIKSALEQPDVEAIASEMVTAYLAETSANKRHIHGEHGIARFVWALNYLFSTGRLK